MNLFIDTISSPAKLIIFNENRNIIDDYSWDIKGNESSTLIPKIDELLKKNNIEYKNLDNIVVVNGPGSFTGVRTTVLAVNSINYIINKNITPISYFELFKDYPILKSSSKRDYFVKFNIDSDIKIIENEKLKNLLTEKEIDKVYGETNKDIFNNVKIVDKIDYISIIKELELENKKQIQALYIKKPNIS